MNDYALKSAKGLTMSKARLAIVLELYNWDKLSGTEFRFRFKAPSGGVFWYLRVDGTNTPLNFTLAETYVLDRQLIEEAVIIIHEGKIEREHSPGWENASKDARNIATMLAWGEESGKADTGNLGGMGGMGDQNQAGESIVLPDRIHEAF